MSTSLPASSTGPVSGPEASALLDARIASLDDWRGAMLARVRALIHEALPIEGVQFHPESIASEYGHEMIRTFLARCTGRKVAA